MKETEKDNNFECNAKEEFFKNSKDYCTGWISVATEKVEELKHEIFIFSYYKEISSEDKKITHFWIWSEGCYIVDDMLTFFTNLAKMGAQAELCIRGGYIENADTIIIERGRVICSSIALAKVNPINLASALAKHIETEKADFALYDIFQSFGIVKAVLNIDVDSCIKKPRKEKIL